MVLKFLLQSIQKYWLEIGCNRELLRDAYRGLTECPRTKSKSSMPPGPSIQWRIFAKSLLLPGENKREFEALHQRLKAEFRPAGESEEEQIPQL